MLPAVGVGAEVEQEGVAVEAGDGIHAIEIAEVMW